MRIIRFESLGRVYWGRAAAGESAHLIEGDLFGSFDITDRQVKVEKLLAPLIPADILCIGLNYREHAKESESAIPTHPVLFIKAGSSLNHPFDPILLPRLSTQVDYECELAVIIGKTARHVRRQEALEYVFGYTAANDVSARDWQRDKALGGGQWARGKSFDTFCPLGPALITADEIPKPNALRLQTHLNGQTLQDCNTSDMIFDIPALIESLSSTMTLRPGTVILTGTPQGVGFARTPPIFLKEGDSVTVEIEKIGRLTNPVRQEE